MGAAHINATPAAANAALVAKAHEIVGNDWPELARHVIGHLQFRTLQPFISDTMAADMPDQYGGTQICNAVRLSDVTAVQAQLQAGADPNGSCAGFSLIGYIVMNGRESHIEDHQTILRLLRGGRPSYPSTYRIVSRFITDRRARTATWRCSIHNRDLPERRASALQRKSRPVSPTILITYFIKIE